MLDNPNENNENKQILMDSYKFRFGTAGKQRR